MQPFHQPAVQTVFAAYPSEIRARLLNLRQLIFETAAATPGVGPLEECLKWGEPAYLTTQSHSGSTLRLGWKPSQPAHYALHFNCRTDLVETIGLAFPGVFHCIGSRSLVFDQDAVPPLGALQRCVGMALTYHLRNKAQPKNQ
ncbi:MAG: DUF1801 domain-containing protein [Pseudomonas sp.]|uniref:DUF1801 domain-containing protein n=1 Tax=Pseudomonas sp. TaxID=306 RepID=UPI003399EB5B